MTADLESLPIVGDAYRLGVNRVTTTLVLLGPVVIGVIAVGGRSPVAVGVGLAYVLALPASVAYFWVTGADAGDAADSDDADEEDDTPDGSDARDDTDGSDEEDDTPDGSGEEADGGASS